MKECNECKKVKALHMTEFDLCLDCYENLFKMPNPFEEEPDFEIKHEVAECVPSKDSSDILERMDKTGYSYYLTDGQYVAFKKPKQMVFDPDCRVKDYDKLILFLLENYVIYEEAKGFDKVRYMFKEVEKDN